MTHAKKKAWNKKLKRVSFLVTLAGFTCIKNISFNLNSNNEWFDWKQRHCKNIYSCWKKKVFKKYFHPRVKQNRVVSAWNFEPNYPIPITTKFLERSARKQKKEFKTKKKRRWKKIGKIRKRLGPKKCKLKKKNINLFE